MANEKKENELRDYDVVAQAKEQARLLMKQFTQNEITLGATFVELKQSGGNPILDRDTKQPLVDLNTGEPKFYPIKYSAVLDFKGGSIETDISLEQKDHLIVGNDYSCKGRLAPVKKFGETHILPVFHSFIEL